MPTTPLVAVACGAERSSDKMLYSINGEAKQQVVEDLARDPESSVTAADARKVIVEESKKAGAVALSFDANATPEEKAAQAKAVSFSLAHLWLLD